MESPSGGLPVRRSSSNRSPPIPQTVSRPSNIQVTRPTPLASAYPDSISHSQAIESGTISNPNTHSHQSGKSALQGSDPEQSHPALQPFFTLLKDKTTEQHYHPEVQYIFSDDDGDEVIDAVVRLEQLRHEYDAAVEQEDHPPRIETDERYIVVKLGADGKTVDSAYCLNDDWQIIDVSVDDAPMLDVGGEGSEQQRRSMLRINGMGEIKGIDHGAGMDAGTIENEIRQFMIKMNELEKVVERAERDFAERRPAGVEASAEFES